MAELRLPLERCRSTRCSRLAMQIRFPKAVREVQEVASAIGRNFLFAAAIRSSFHTMTREGNGRGGYGVLRFEWGHDGQDPGLTEFQRRHESKLSVLRRSSAQGDRASQPGLRGFIASMRASGGRAAPLPSFTSFRQLHTWPSGRAEAKSGPRPPARARLPAP